MCFSKLLWFNNNKLKYSRFGRNNETFGCPDIAGLYSKDDLAEITEATQRNGACLWFNNSNIWYPYISLSPSRYAEYLGQFGLSLQVSIHSINMNPGACLWFNNRILTVIEAGHDTNYGIRAGTNVCRVMYRDGTHHSRGACLWFNNADMYYSHTMCSTWNSGGGYNDLSSHTQSWKITYNLGACLIRG